MALCSWDAEADAAAVVQSRLGGVTRRVDPGGGPLPLHDFDVWLPDNTVIAVEVTEHTVPARRSVLAEVDRREYLGGRARSAGLPTIAPSDSAYANAPRTVRCRFLDDARALAPSGNAP
jgi:hypothetical protein